MDASTSLTPPAVDTGRLPGTPASHPGSRTPVAVPELWLRPIAVRTRERIVIVPTESITRVDAEGNYVRLWAGHSLLHKETLSDLCARLDPAEFLRVHRSHAINLRAVVDLVPRQHGEFRIRLADGAAITSGRLFKDAVRHAFGLS